MAIRRSTAFINELASGKGVKEALKDCVLYVYSGSQPETADLTASGTMLIKYTLNGNTHVDATRAMATIAIGGAATGSIDTVTVGGMGFNLLTDAVDYTSSAAITAGLIVESINAKQNPLNIVAEQNSDSVELYCPYQLGADGNGLSFATTVSGALTATPSGTLASGVSAVNGLNFGETITDGSINKSSSLWQGEALASGTAGYFRIVAAGSTPDGVTGNDVRFDGTVGVSGTDLIIGTTAITAASIYTISAATIVEPAE